MGIIYKATSKDGKVYIGQTIQTLAARKSAHAYRAKKGDKRTAFQLALLAEGFANFAWEEIDTAETSKELDVKEKQWIACYKSDNPEYGYNIFGGGISAKLPESTKRKISSAHKGKKVSEKERQRLAEMSRNITPETRQKISEAKKGKYTGGNHPMFGKHHTAESRQKMSEAKTGRQGSRRGTHPSSETRQKISKTLTGLIVGENAAASKITEATARKILSELVAGERGVDIARRYGVTKHIVSKIKIGKTWGWLKITA